MAYLTVEQIRESDCFDFSDAEKYSDDLLEQFLNRATLIVDAYMGQSIEYKETTNKVLATPMFDGQLNIRLKRRFIDTISELRIRYSYPPNHAPLMLESGDYAILTEEGMIETVFGACPQYLFDQATTQKFIAEVTYYAGFSELPDDFVGVLCEIMAKLGKEYDVANSPDPVPTSNEIQRYKTLNEDVTFASKKTPDAVNPLLTNYLQEILNHYRIGKSGIGVYM